MISTADAIFFITFSTRLVIEQSLQQTEEHISSVRNVVRDLLKLAIEKTDFLSDVIPPSTALALIEACVKCSHADLAELVIDKLLVPRVSADAAQKRTCSVLIPLIPQLIPSDRPIPGLVKLCRVAVENYMPLAASRTPTDTELSAIFDAIVGAKDNSLLPKM